MPSLTGLPATLAIAIILALPAAAAAQGAVVDSAAPAVGPGDALQPGDAVRLRIWREPDLSGDFPVNENGVATLPKLGAISVVRHSVPDLTAMLMSEYATYLRNPSIEVVPLRRVNVSGSVQKPGLYLVDPTMTVADALTQAGGVSSDGKKDRVDLLRDGKRLNVGLLQDTRIGDAPIRSGDKLYVPQRSWISRNPWIVGAAVSATTTIIIAATRH